jgi:hypothetical protein
MATWLQGYLTTWLLTMARNEGQYGGWLCQNMRRSNKFYEFKMAEI